MNQSQFNQALLALVPGAKFSHNDVPDDFSDTVQVGPFAVQWMRGQSECPQLAVIETKWAELEPRQAALQVIAATEVEQVRRLTPRADREFRLAVYQALAALRGFGSLASHPAFLVLNALDDTIKVERAKL